MSTAGTQTPDYEHADIHSPWGGDAFGRGDASSCGGHPRRVHVEPFHDHR